MVFQSYALWPHMTVRKNIGYPLKARRIDKATARQWVDETAALVDCQTLLDRYPGQLSGGQQQRIALARGLVARPELVLFDEPLSNLDARLRDQVRTEIHELHSRLGFTAVYVTHDQSEALALGDRLAIMRTGRIEQLAPPEEVYEQPATEYVAGFIGMSNRLALDVTGDGVFHNGVKIGEHGEAVGLAPGSYVVRSRGRRRPARSGRRPVAGRLVLASGCHRRLRVRRARHARRRRGRRDPRLVLDPSR